MMPVTLSSTVLRADIAERKSCIEAHQRDIKKLEEDIRVKKSTVIQNKENAKRYDDESHSTSIFLY